MTQATEAGALGMEGMKLWKVVAVVGSGDDRWIVLRPCSHESR